MTYPAFSNKLASAYPGWLMRRLWEDKSTLGRNAYRYDEIYKARKPCRRFETVPECLRKEIV